MPLHNYPGRLLLATSVSSALLLATSVAVAVYLNAQQLRTAEVLNENIGSRRAAANLHETLVDLAALHERKVTNLEPLFERVRLHLSEIDRLADKGGEQELAQQVTDSFARYLLLCALTDSSVAAEYLTTRMIPECDRLRDFNALEIEKSELDHRTTLRRLTWGFVAVGVLGSAAGLLLGYGLARGLRRAMDSLLIRLQDASGMQEVATVEWQRDGRSVLDGPEGLANRVEQIVRQLQQREQDVRRAERLAAVGQLAAGVAHEIRNPLTSVLLLIQMARLDPAAGALTDADLALIDSELGRIEQSLRTLLDYARPPKLERVKCDLTAVAESAVQLVRGRAGQQGVTVRFIPPEAITLDADPGQLRQVVVNLMLNALDAMPTGGNLELNVGRDGTDATLTVTDTGPGITPAMLPRLFEPFATGKETGVGLGLVVSRRIVEDHGGVLHGFNRPVGGATFVMRLPIG
ncbi:histidine kinase : Histidine kinase OS=Singulisphaera acidiphila (strain ATCC BAA-1392 / DSM 18658 / VKM B-2454 / MOB10) GN=Sinac_1279 PE=4 SV=1: HisKA: HATPase_c [Gemmata massiliana]|uniref:histidine kinase n=1 Tax=Gemmata massiliana TaxID=1210884 RepID=A0A6P2CXM2_9BACT|nr:ATP-binding protein [Gemmata massiliana]VTR93643.1 histidine kinase : Histidine kinase OS=Singulisphaera acidiphila (strain ATCC BAA-1392 / DSM 18658 / VKM B-2454 / MOB10) GN=Sinac_1279 PE=4 SV=1: HisKA: HATPase_c [Gemmata massiliana]